MLLNISVITKSSTYEISIRNKGIFLFKCNRLAIIKAIL